MLIVTFERIGRNHNVAPLRTTAPTPELLEHAIYKHARPHLRSRDVEVILNDDLTGGVIACGMHSGGAFTIKQEG